MRFLAILAVALTLGAGPVFAQGESRPGIEPETGVELEGMAATMMDRDLPFRDGQLLRYFNPETGAFEGHATRRKLTIRFYDVDGKFVGRAERATQQVTRYYDAEGRYVGRRINKRMTTRQESRTAPPPAPKPPEEE